MSANGASPAKKLREQLEAKKLTLTYFSGFAGRAFGIRAALRHADVPFEYVTADGEFTTLKADTQKLPLSALPTLEIEEKDGSSTIFVQSTSLSRWAGRLANLYPEDAMDQLIVDEAMDTINELIYKVSFDPDLEVRGKRNEALLANDLPKYMRLLDARLKLREGPYLLGSRISVADLYVYGMLRCFVDGYGEPQIPKTVVAEDFPDVFAYYSRVEADPIAQAEIKADNPCTTTH